MSAIDEGRITEREIRDLVGADYSTVSKWHSNKITPVIFEAEDLEITPGRSYFLGKALGTSFIKSSGYVWKKEGKDVFDFFIYPQLVQETGVLPKAGEKNSTIINSTPDGFNFCTRIGRIKHAFLRSLENLDFIELQDNGSYRIVVQTGTSEGSYFQGLFDKYGYAGLHGGAPYLHFSSGKKWRDLLSFLTCGVSPVTVTRMDYHRVHGVELERDEKEMIEKFFPVVEFEVEPYKEANESARFWLAPAYLTGWLERENALGKGPEPDAVAENITYLGRAALHSSNPKKANRIADCLEKMASAEYGRSYHTVDREFQQNVSRILREEEAVYIVKEIRDRFPKKWRGYSIYIHPLWAEQEGMGRKDIEGYIEASCSRLRVPDKYPKKRDLMEMLDSGTVLFDFRL